LQCLGETKKALPVTDSIDVGFERSFGPFGMKRFKNEVDFKLHVQRRIKADVRRIDVRTYNTAVKFRSNVASCQVDPCKVICSTGLAIAEYPQYREQFIRCSESCSDVHVACLSPCGKLILTVLETKKLAGGAT
jgi:hypothetical protein